jgi:ferredoxin
MERPDSEVALAARCSSALERGDRATARDLATRGLHLALATADDRWIRRFRHLLRVATGEPIQAPPQQPTPCSFCLTGGPLNLTAGLSALICDDCVEVCATGGLEGSSIERIGVNDLRCSLCGECRPNGPLFEAHGHRICQPCVEYFAEEAKASK